MNQDHFYGVQYFYFHAFCKVREPGPVFTKNLKAKRSKAGWNDGAIFIETDASVRIRIAF